MTKIKIAFIISNLGQGGAESQFVKLITNMDKSKFDIRLLLYATQTDPFFEQILKRHQINITKVKLKNRFIPFKIAEALYVINRFITINKFDIIVSTLFMNNLFVRIAAPQYYNNKIVTNIRTSIQYYSSLYIFFEKLFIRKSFIVFNSNQTLESFKSVFPIKYHNRLSLIYNGYSLPEEKLEAKTKNLIFGSLGRLSNEKNLLQSVRVFQEFEKKNPGTRYVIQGHFGNQYNTIKEILISDNIEIKEKDPDVEVFYNSINVLILPSLFEGCPNVLFEALLRKKICIVSAAANSDNFIIDRYNGFVYDGTDNGLIKTMQEVKHVYNTRRAEEIKEQGFRYASENFSISSMVKQYEQLFFRIYEENKSRS